ncbi:MAG: hypothetical protein LUQ65_13225 [Candidatus Helarchaeota archaeon]|nr:hypothetical protein [Candidatus Helarchaeota archaeon]
MHDKRYIFGIFFFFVFFTILLLYIWPSGPGNARIGSYFTKPPSGHIHYSQVPDGTNMTACVVIENTPFNAFDIINYSFYMELILDLPLIGDPIIVSKTWVSNFTLYRNQVTTIKLNFTASYNESVGARGIFIDVEWGETGLTEYLRMSGLLVGPTEEVVSAFDLASAMIVIASIGLGLSLLLVAVTARQDFQEYLKKRKASQAPTPMAAPTPPPTPPEAAPVHPPVSTVLPSVAPPAPEHRLVETMVLIPCPRCGSKLDKSQVVCATCGHEFQKCVVCNLIIEDDEQTQSCPECGALGHRDHFREWVHVNGKCPICKKPLNF